MSTELNERILPGSCYGNYDSKDKLCTKACIIRENCLKTSNKIKNGFEDKSPREEKSIPKEEIVSVVPKIEESEIKKEIPPFELFINFLKEEFKFVEEAKKENFKAYFFEGFHIILSLKTMGFQVKPDEAEMYVSSKLETSEDSKKAYSTLKDVINAYE